MVLKVSQTILNCKGELAVIRIQIFLQADRYVPTSYRDPKEGPAHKGLSLGSFAMQWDAARAW